MKFYNVEIILYPDSITYDTIDILHKAQSLCNCAYIYHDKDEDKKPHYHLLCFFNTQHSLDAYAKKFNIEKNMIQIIKNKVGAIQYLIHKNNPEKYQYDINEISSNFDISKYFNNRVEKENQVIYDILSYINSADIIYLKEFLNYIINNDYWADYRRNAYIINQYITEHNYYLTTKEQSINIKL